MAASASRRAVILLSGGLDSSTALAWAKAEGRQMYALSFAYGQRHRAELECATHQAAAVGVQRHEIVSLDGLGEWVKSKTSLVKGSTLEVPQGIAPGEGAIPSTYVPARNTLFLAYALALAECVEAQEIWIGVNALDYSGYPDCRPEFVEAFEKLANLATKSGVEGKELRLRAPLQNLSKAQIVHEAMRLEVDIRWTVSCYDPLPGEEGTPALACGTCDSCVLRRRGFERAGVSDPTCYR